MPDNRPKPRSEPIAFLDVQVNHITKDTMHINNKVFLKNGSKIGNFQIPQAFAPIFLLFQPHFFRNYSVISPYSGK